MSRDEPASVQTSAQALSRFATRVQKALNLQGEVNISITSSHEIQNLNRRFRRKNKATDVLSFPSCTPGVAGDIAISLEIAADNASQLGHSLADEVRILILHGMLHLAGFDHEIDNGEMRLRESELRAKYGLPIGLIERSHAAAAKPGRRKGSRA